MSPCIFLLEGIVLSWKHTFVYVRAIWEMISQECFSNNESWVIVNTKPASSAYNVTFFVVVIPSVNRVQLFATPWTVTRQAPLSMKFSQTRILEWVAVSFSRGSSQPRDPTCVSCVGRQILYH